MNARLLAMLLVLPIVVGACGTTAPIPTVLAPTAMAPTAPAPTPTPPSMPLDEYAGIVSDFVDWYMSYMDYLGAATDAYSFPQLKAVASAHLTESMAWEAKFQGIVPPPGFEAHHTHVLRIASYIVSLTEVAIDGDLEAAAAILALISEEMDLAMAAMP